MTPETARAAADRITVGALIVPQHGEMDRLRHAWLQAEALGVDRLYTCDHFFVPRSEDLAAQLNRVAAGSSDEPPPTPELSEGWEEPKNFEAITVEAAMCATTTRSEIACLVHCNPFRNANLMADMARTMDHISGGRFVLGIGCGFHRRDFEEYGYELGTYGSRLRDLDRDLGVIRRRWERLSPPPMRKIPILMAGGGEKLTLRIVATHADEWHYFGDVEYLKRKSEKLDEWCEHIGRDPGDIRRVAALLGDTSPDVYVEAGFTHLVAFSYGPKWDLAGVQELVEWRDAQNGPRR